MLETPDYDRLMVEFGPKFDESPWSPEILENPVWKLAEDYELPPLPLCMMLPRLTAMVTPTQVLEVIGNADAS